MPRYPQTDRLLSSLSQVLRTRGYSVRTEQTYVRWAARFLAHHGHPHPANLGREEVEQFLIWLTESRGSAKTRNQAASALAFLYLWKKIGG